MNGLVFAYQQNTLNVFEQKFLMLFFCKYFHCYFSKTNAAWSTVTPTVLHSCTCLICLFSITIFGCKFEILLITWLEAININTVFATLRLSLLAIRHFLPFSKLEFTAASRRVIESPEAVRFVSSANNRGFVFDRHCGKSLMYNKRNYALNRALWHTISTHFL